MFDNAQFNFTLENVLEVKYNYIDCIGSLFILNITKGNDVYYNYIADKMTTSEIRE